MRKEWQKITTVATTVMVATGIAAIIIFFDGLINHTVSQVASIHPIGRPTPAGTADEPMDKDRRDDGTG